MTSSSESSDEYDHLDFLFLCFNVEECRKGPQKKKNSRLELDELKNVVLFEIGYF